MTDVIKWFIKWLNFLTLLFMLIKDLISFKMTVDNSMTA